MADEGRIVGHIRPEWRRGPSHGLERDRPPGHVVDPLPDDPIAYRRTINSPGAWIDYTQALGLPGPVL